MHLNDTILLDTPTGVGLLVGGAIVTATGIAIGSRRMSAEETARAGMMAAFVFVASSIHFPVPISPTPIHLGLYGLAGVLLGYRVLLVSPIAFGLQAVLFGHGGFYAVGLNALNMSVGALIARLWYARVYDANANRRLTLAAFGAGFFGIAIMGLLTLAELIAIQYSITISAIAPLWLGTAVVEGFVTVIVLATLQRHFPELLPAAPGRAQPARSDDATAGGRNAGGDAAVTEAVAT